MGVFGKRLSERSEFPITAHEAEQRRKQAGGGSLFFGYFLLATQKKVTRLEVKKNITVLIKINLYSLLAKPHRPSLQGRSEFIRDWI